MKIYFLLLIQLIILISCASKEKSIYSGGSYKDQKIGENIFQVTFEGNSFSSHEHVQTMLNVRCAEVALNNGSRYYIILKDRERVQGLLSGGMAPVMIQQNYTMSHIIQLVEAPVPNNLNYDAYEMFQSYKNKVMGAAD